MKVCIIEDEQLAAERLSKMIVKYDPSTDIVFQADSIKKSVDWLKKNPHPDLAFFDIQLADGISFQIFEQITLKCPVIFTTAYDEYAIRAFKVNSIDYLLKPIDFEELSGAIEKFKRLRFTTTEYLFPGKESLNKFMQLLTNRYKNRFVIKVGEHLKTIEVDNILFFYSLEKATYCVTSDNRHYVLDYSLEHLEGLVDPQHFFRINRKYLIAFSAILDIVSYSNSRLKIELKNAEEDMIIVSREKVQDFKAFLDR
jgi:DNA-binding LytR/AlgR family response regulator